MTAGPRGVAPPFARGARRRARPGGEDGMVTAETAVALPAVVLVLALGLGAAGLGVDTVRCVDAARVGARAAARGDDGAVAARRAAPDGSGITHTRAGGDVRVDVVAPARPLTGWLPAGLRPHAHAVALVEDPTPTTGGAP